MSSRNELHPYTPRRGGGFRPTSRTNISLGASFTPRRLVQVAAGIDTLHLFTRAPVSAAWVERLAFAKEAAKEDDERPQTLVVGGLELQVKPFGTASGAFLLSSDLYVVKVAPEPKGDASPTVSVEIRALALWSRSWKDAADVAIETMGALCSAQRPALDVQVTRLDLCMDFQGWVPVPEDLDRFVCRVRKASRGRHHGTKWLAAEEEVEAEKSRALALLARLQAAKSNAEAAEVLRELHREDTDATASTWGDQRAFTGFSFGRGIIAARLYDKTRELSVSRKGWFREVWRRSGKFDEEKPVWRLEFQLRREALVDFHGVAGGDAAWHLGRWDEAAYRLERLWKYLSRNWLRHGHRTAASRKVPSSQWVRVQAWSPNTHALPELHRINLRESSLIVLPQLAGYLASATAQLVELDPQGQRVTNAALPFSALVVQALAAAHAYAESKERHIEDKFKERRAASVARKRALCGPRRAQVARMIGRDLDVGRQQGPLFVNDLLRDFGFGSRFAETPAQRYAERLGILVKHDAGDDELEATERRHRAELDNEIAALRRQLFCAREVDDLEAAEELSLMLHQKERLAEPEFGFS